MSESFYPSTDDCVTTSPRDIFITSLADCSDLDIDSFLTLTIRRHSFERITIMPRHRVSCLRQNVSLIIVKTVIDWASDWTFMALWPESIAVLIQNQWTTSVTTPQTFCFEGSNSAMRVIVGVEWVRDSVILRLNILSCYVTCLYQRLRDHSQRSSRNDRWVRHERFSCHVALTGRPPRDRGSLSCFWVVHFVETNVHNWR